MNIIDGLLTIREDNELLDKVINEGVKKDYKSRYESECVFTGLLAEYALNKEKNKCKPNFENLFTCDVFTILLSEIKELENEIIREKIDPRRAFEEIADCAAVLVGLVVNLRDKLKAS